MFFGIYIDDIKIGEATLKIIDESMGGVGGEFIPNENYKSYSIKIQELTEKKGLANVEDFNFSIELGNGDKIVPEGGIGILDALEFNELHIEAAGLNPEIINILKTSKNPIK